MHGELVELEAALVKARRLELAIVRAEAQTEEDVFPFNIEVHQPFDVDDDRVALPVHEHVIGPEFPVDQAVVRTRGNAAGVAAQRVLQGGTGRGDPRAVDSSSNTAR